MDAPRRPPERRSSLPDAARVEWLLNQLFQRRAEMLRRAEELAPRLGAVAEANRPSARNLVHYLALRSNDLRELQLALAWHGLSSLGRAEPHALWNVDAVIRLLRRLCGGPDDPLPGAGEALSPEEGQARAIRMEEALLGPKPAGREVRVMVTAPTELASDYGLVRALLDAGMDCLRINCAHDDEAVWARMLANLRRGQRETGRSCRVLMDLAGPRVRTGPLEEGQRVVQIRPPRDPLGRVTAPARVWLSPAERPEAPPGPADAMLPMPGDFLAPMEVGDRVRVEDARGKKRRLEIVAVEGPGRWATLDKTAYVATGATARWKTAGPPPREAEAVIGPLPPVERYLTLAVGDTLVLTRAQRPGLEARPAVDGAAREPARIPVSPPEALDGVRRGERIWFDDGRIGGVIRGVGAGEVLVEITSAKPGGSKLRAGKGINLPDSSIGFPALMEKDLADLPFIARHADVVGYSYVRSGSDVRALQAELARLGGGEMGIVLKIETARAFEQLPDLLVAAMRSPVVGVMIARGDLAVESGFPRLAEVQEEILWLCEAAHVPVVWATQVLEQLAKTGRPSRAEVTDAAMAERAECVMLNKGPYLVDAVRALDSILQRMQGHQEKKRSTMRKLSVADAFFSGGGDGPARDAGAHGPPPRRNG